MRPSKQPQHDQAVALDAARAAFVAALRHGNVLAVADRYAADARLIAPSAVFIGGRQDITRFWQAGMEAGLREIELQPERIDLEAGGRVALETGRYAMSVQPADGPPVMDRGRYALAHRLEQDGAWRRALEAFTPDPPPTRRR